MYLFESMENSLKKVLDHFLSELKLIRAGRASVSLVEDIKVDVYGGKMFLKEVASISVPEPRQILIQVWDKGIAQSVEKAIRTDGRFNPIMEGDILRIAISPLTGEKRKELVKEINSKLEQSRVAARNIREEIWQDIQTKENEKNISEDEKYRAKEELQKIIGKYNKNLEEMASRKEEEIMRV